MVSDRERVRRMAVNNDWRLSHHASVRDEFSPVVGGNAVIMVDYQPGSERLEVARMFDSRTRGSRINIHTRSLLVLGAWIEDKLTVDCVAEVVFEHTDADGHGLQLVRLLTDDVEVPGYHLRVLDRHGGTMATTKLRGPDLAELSLSIEGLR